MKSSLLYLRFEKVFDMLPHSDKILSDSYKILFESQPLNYFAEIFYSIQRAYIYHLM